MRAMTKDDDLRDAVAWALYVLRGDASRLTAEERRIADAAVDLDHDEAAMARMRRALAQETGK